MSRNKGGNGGNGGGKSKNTNTSADYDELRRQAKDRQQRGRRRIGAPTVPLQQSITQDRLAELFEAASTEIHNFGEARVLYRGTRISRWRPETVANAIELLRSYIYENTSMPVSHQEAFVREMVREAFAQAVFDMQDRGVTVPWLPGRGTSWFRYYDKTRPQSVLV